MKYVFLFVVIIGLGIASFYENSSSTSQAYEDTELSKRESKGVAFYKEQFLESISKTNKADLGALVTDFLDTKVVSRKEKVKIVMGLLDQELDDIDFQYMSSTLSFLNPHEVSDDIVSMIIRTEIPARKAALLNVLGDAFYKEQKPTNLTGKESHLMFSRQQKVRDFLFSTVKSSDNDEVFRAAYSSYMNVFSFEEVLASTDLLFSGNRNPGYSREKLTNDLLRKASTDENLFGKFIPEVLSDKYPKDEEFYDTLSFWIEKSDSKIPSETADLLKKMLKVQIESLPDDVVASSATEMSEIMTKIQAYSKLSDTPGITQANKVVNFTIDNFIIKSNDIAKFSGVIMLVDEATLSIFKKRKEEVLPSLNASLKDPSIDANKTELFTEAIRVLSE